MHTIITAGSIAPPPSGQPPELNLVRPDVEALAAELVAYHAEFAPLFRRAEQRHWALAYLHGQLLELERKTIEPMALALDGGDVQAMQQFISQGAWDDEAVLHRHHELVADTVGDPQTGVLILDGCDFPKQGHHSVGVARQWCGALGKVANCQASVVAAYASVHGYTLVDRRLYLPESWFTPAYAARRQKCGVPADVAFRTRPALAGELFTGLVQRGVLPFRWVVCDEQFGNNPDLLDQIAAAERWYLAEVPHDTRVWRSRPPTFVPPPTGKRGRPFQRERLTPAAPPPLRVDDLASQLPATAWQRYQIKEGAKGPLVAQFAFLRVLPVRQGLPGAEHWLVLRRNLEDTPVLKTYVSNAPAATPRTTLVAHSGMRWPVETAILEGKRECGLDHYEVRGWVGWHHHVTMTFLAHHFLVRQRCRLGKKSRRLDRAASADALTGGAAQAAPRRRHRDCAHPIHPGPELCRLLLPPTSDQAAAQRLVTK
jgi:SRSO17 transposase